MPRFIRALDITKVHAPWFSQRQHALGKKYVSKKKGACSIREERGAGKSKENRRKNAAAGLFNAGGEIYARPCVSYLLTHLKPANRFCRQGTLIKYKVGSERLTRRRPKWASAGKKDTQNSPLSAGEATPSRIAFCAQVAGEKKKKRKKKGFSGNWKTAVLRRFIDALLPNLPHYMLVEIWSGWLRMAAEILRFGRAD